MHTYAYTVTHMCTQYRHFSENTHIYTHTHTHTFMHTYVHTMCTKMLYHIWTHTNTHSCAQFSTCSYTTSKHQFTSPKQTKHCLHSPSVCMCYLCTVHTDCPEQCSAKRGSGWCHQDWHWCPHCSSQTGCRTQSCSQGKLLALWRAGPAGLCWLQPEGTRTVMQVD